MEQFLLEVEDRIKDLDGTIPSHRACYKRGYSFSDRTFEEQLPIWNYIWKNSNGSRAQIHSFLFLESRMKRKELHRALWDTSKAWQEDVEGWGFCDALAKINTQVLVTFPAEVYQQLKEWNTADDIWKRRQSVVSLLYYSKTKKEHPSFGKIAALVKPLLDDSDYYVQKGVGWTLREMYTVYPEQAIEFYRKNIKSISAIAFIIAMEKTPGKIKEELKLLRKK